MKYEPKYLPLALAALAGRQPAAVHHVTVLHDDWCGVFQAPQRPCDCEPEIQKDGDES